MEETDCFPVVRWNPSRGFVPEMGSGFFWCVVSLGVTTENTDSTEFHGKKTQNTAASRLTEYTERIYVLESGGSTRLWRCVREFFAVVDLAGIFSGSCWWVSGGRA
ncbi:hypothetical protein O0S10_07935 [Methanocorpusculum sp. MG]|uniref:Uncharacterized protein n=1 Tax=Methanocorpusculum petauri TaxID=3002863 RepID=A0ABT4IHD6_9EURY|nr:hypothetical protein [Methanocorpusculum petauri]MCZ0861149.1 hypothetical protein [Methanocorpusculum petauri]